MKTNYEVRYASHPEDAKNYDTKRIRRDFLIEKVFAADEVNMVYSMYDRMVVGGAMPVNEELKLEAIDPLKADYFTTRREIGIFNVGAGEGTVKVGDETFPLGYKEVVCDEHPEPSDPPKHYREVYTEEADRIRVGWEEYTPVSEPQPDPEQLREMAYRAEADQYLMAYEGYLAEGKILEADEQKALYLAKKAEIRERFPDK